MPREARLQIKDIVNIHTLIFFLIIIDFVMHKTMNDFNYGIKWEYNRLTDLDFADDFALLSDNKNSLKTMTKNLSRFGAQVRLCISEEKIKTL